MRLSHNSFWNMSPREFFNAWSGHNKAKTDEYNAFFWMFKFNAVRTAFSDKQAKGTANAKSPWERKRKKEMSQKHISMTLDLISTNGK